MKWITQLFSKPGTKRPAPAVPPTAKPSQPPADLELLRGALARAVASAERQPLADRLGQALAAQGQAPQRDDGPEVWVAAICHAPDKALALDWLARLEGDAWLGQVAVQARSAEVRLAAAQRIGANEVLDQVAHASRGKDKRVHRHCAELVRQRRLAEASAQRAQEISTELQGLLDVSGPLPLSHLLELKKELSALDVAGEAGRACQALLDQALARVRQEAEARRDLQANLDAAAALVEECDRPAWLWPEQIQAWQARLNGLRQSRADLSAWLAKEAAVRGLDASLQAIESRLTALSADADRSLACEQFFDALAADEAPSTDAAAAWAALPKPEHGAAREALAARWQALADKTPRPAEHEAAPAPPPRAGIDHAAVRRLLNGLEQAVEAGHLADADAAANRIKDTLGEGGLHGALEARLHRALAQLDALRGWARWGTGQARDQLIAAAEALLNGEQDVDTLAGTIPALREEWKRLNAHGAASKAQWERFDAALEQAYVPVAARRAETEARQAEAAGAKEALCAAWEAELAGIVWEHADFKVIEARRAELLKAWHALPHAGFRAERPLRKRFDGLVADIEQHLDAARAAEIERREQLIAAAEVLKQQPDLGQAMAEAKALQGRWNPPDGTVRLRRSEEQRLWQRFRAACGAVFERRDAQRAEQAAQRHEQAQARERLLAAFAAALVDADANGIKHALDQFRVDWHAARATGRNADDDLESRARDLQAQAEQRLAALRQAKHRTRFDLLAQKAALAERVEAAVLAGGPVEAVQAEVQRAWEMLPRLSGKDEGLLAQRLATASGVTEAVLAEGRETRETVLLDLEIDLDLPSPERYAEQRRQRQLARLQQRFGADAAARPGPETLLAQCYATAAPPDAAVERRMAAVADHLAARAVPRGAASR